MVLKQQMFQMTEDTSEINMQPEYDELALLLASQLTSPLICFCLLGLGHLIVRTHRLITLSRLPFS